VSTARAFLNGLSSSEPLYQQIIARSNQKPAVVFNRLYPGSDRFVINTYAVPAAFTKAGWAATETNIRNITDYFKGEEWVLGPAAFANIDKTRLQNELQARYKADFAKHWREYLRRTSVVRFTSIQDAANKLSTLGGNQSPLLEVLCLASDNTSVDTSIQALFQPPQQVVPPGCADHLSSQSNDNYMQSLIALQASLTALTTEESNDSLRANALAKATEADVTVQQAARKFTIDKEGVIDSQTRNVLEAPVKYVQTLLAGAGKEDANGAARSFCSQFTALMRKYPFAPFSTQIASPTEVNNIFAPNQGALWKLYQEHLQKYLLLTGATFSPRPGAASTLNPAFAYFLNRAAGVSDALYHGGPAPQLSFDLRVIPDENVQSVFLTVHGQALNYSANTPAGQHFTWPGGGPEEIKMRVKFAGGTELEYPAHSGPWDVFRFFSEVEQWQVRGNEYTMDKPLRSGGGTITVPATGRPATVRLALGMTGAASLLKPGAFSGLGCVAAAVK
jgi:type VI secretion system protein ImpL